MVFVKSFFKISFNLNNETQIANDSTNVKFREFTPSIL